MKKVILSIIIPLFNAELYVERIVSDIVQNNKEISDLYEIILVDDGSSDNTPEICRVVKESINNILYKRKVNGGIASARNYGLSIACGKYVTFADQDDRILSGYKEFLNKCDNEKLDILITSPFNKTEKSKKLKQRVFRDEIIGDKKRIIKIAGKLIDGNYLSDSNTQFVSTSVWNVIYRREMLLKGNIKFKAFIDYEDDWIFNIESLLAADKVGISSNGYYCWYIYQQSESHRKKYINNLLERRKDWMNWLCGIIQIMNIEQKKQEDFFSKVLYPRNIMMCFNNACWQFNVKYDKIFSEITEACQEWKLENLDLKTVEEMDYRSKYLLKLLKQGRTTTAVLLNKVVFRKHFH